MEQQLLPLQKFPINSLGGMVNDSENAKDGYVKDNLKARLVVSGLVFLCYLLGFLLCDSTVVIISSYPTVVAQLLLVNVCVCVCVCVCGGGGGGICCGSIKAKQTSQLSKQVS